MRPETEQATWEESGHGFVPMLAHTPCQQDTGGAEWGYGVESPGSQRFIPDVGPEWEVKGAPSSPWTCMQGALGTEAEGRLVEEG